MKKRKQNKKQHKNTNKLPKINALHVIKPDQLALNRNPQIGLCVRPDRRLKWNQVWFFPTTTTPTPVYQLNPPAPITPG